MTIPELFGKPPAREAALFRYAIAHDKFSEQEQIAVAKGETAEAEFAHRHGLYALRAYRAELDDPRPKP